MSHEIAPPLLISRHELSLTKLMVSHHLSNLTVTNQIAYDQRIRRRDGPPLQGAGFQIRNPRYHHFYLTELLAVFLEHPPGSLCTQ